MSDTTGKKRCVYCAEYINDMARICPNCRSELVPIHRPPPQSYTGFQIATIISLCFNVLYSIGYMILVLGGGVFLILWLCMSLGLMLGEILFLANLRSYTGHRLKNRASTIGAFEILVGLFSCDPVRLICGVFNMVFSGDVE